MLRRRHRDTLRILDSQCNCTQAAAPNTDTTLQPLLHMSVLAEAITGSHAHSTTWSCGRSSSTILPQRT
ncbi:TPA: hypothetical protein ACH3X2_005096 [Trebouxia sp. C0005]